MTFYINNQEDLEQLCFQAPLPESICFLRNSSTMLNKRHVPLICHDGLNTLLIQDEISCLNSSQTQLNGSIAKNMFGKELLNSTSVECLEIFDSQICGLFLHLLHRKPIFNNLRAIRLWWPLMNNKGTLLFGKAVKFSQQLHTVEFLATDSTTNLPANITASASNYCLFSLSCSYNLKRVYFPKQDQVGFSKMRLALMHKRLNETNCQWPEFLLEDQNEAFVVKQIFAQLARRPRNYRLSIKNRDWQLLPTAQRDYISSERVSSGFQSVYAYKRFFIN